MDLLATVDQILDQIDSPSLSGEDRLLGIPASLAGINLNALKVQIEERGDELQGQTGRKLNRAVILLDVLATDTEGKLGSTIEDYCLLTKSALRDLIQAALYDNLTGLYSRNALQVRLREEFRRARRYGLPLSAIFIETDAFKSINDTYGHLEGDRVLAYIGRFISAHLRDVDFPARYGGDEFVVILPHTSGDIALSLARRLHSRIREDQKDAHLCRPVTISIGVGTIVPEFKTESDFLDAADRAAYKAKINKDMVWPVVNADPDEKPGPS